ncbi:MAG: transporter substrate-binding domain-containing protein [Desulfovibrio sp.]|nr:transporter substrate-binding domain-containing protein [Desulfovibrio sp.]
MTRLTQNLLSLCRVLVPAICIAVVPAGSAFAADALADIKKANRVKIAVPQDFPPFGSIGKDMQPVGYDIDTAKLIAEGLGVRLELVPVTSTNRIPYLTTGKVDLVISSLGKNPERAQVIDFSNAYAPFYSGVFGPADTSVKVAADLAGKSIAVTRGAIEDLALTEVAPAGAVIRRFEDNSATIAAYLSGQTQLIATGNIVVAGINGQNPGVLLETKFMLKNSPCYVGLNKNQIPLLEAVNSIIDKAKKDGALEKISRTWLHFALPPDL